MTNRRFEASARFLRLIKLKVRHKCGVNQECITASAVLWVSVGAQIVMVSTGHYFWVRTAWAVIKLNPKLRKWGRRCLRISSSRIDDVDDGKGDANTMLKRHEVWPRMFPNPPAIWHKREIHAKAKKQFITKMRKGNACDDNNKANWWQLWQQRKCASVKVQDSGLPSFYDLWLTGSTVP